MEVVKCSCNDTLKEGYEDNIEFKSDQHRKNLDDVKYKEGFEECCNDWGATTFRGNCSETDNRECTLIDVKFQNCIREKIADANSANVTTESDYDYSDDTATTQVNAMMLLCMIALMRCLFESILRSDKV